MMRTVERSAFVVGLVMLGCSSAELSQNGQSVERNESEPAVVGGTVVFRDDFGKNGRFVVVRAEDGRLSANVSQSIEDGQDLVTAAGQQPSLADVYGVLHPKAAHAPPALVELSEEFSRAMAAAGARSRTDAVENSGALASPKVIEHPYVDGSEIEQSVSVKSLNTFNATVCKDINAGVNARWKKISCTYKNVYLVQAYCYESGDRSYAWNDSSQPAMHSVYPCHPTQYQVPANWYTYSWWTFNGCPCGEARLMGTPNAGSLGVTVHRYQVTPQ